MRTGQTHLAYVAVVERAGYKEVFIAEDWPSLLDEERLPAAFTGSRYERPTINEDQTLGCTEEGDAVGFYLTHLLSYGIH